MAKRNWTGEQQRAIDARKKNLLVAAAAGSGKTAVLVERIIKMVLAGECDVDELLVVTFTHAAAEEMQERIESALMKQMTEERDADKLARLDRQIVLLSGASITTIDSFCQSILRRNFSEIDLDPRFRVASEEELRLMQQDVLEELFQQKYEEGNEEFLRFTDAFGGSERGDEALYGLVLRLYHFSQSQPFPQEWLQGLAVDFSPEAVTGLSDTKWYDAATHEIRLGIQQALEEHGEALRLTEELGADFYLENLQEDEALLQSIHSALQANSWQELYHAFTLHDFGRLKTAPKGTEDAVKLPVKHLRDSYKKLVQSLRTKYFRQTEQELLEDLRAAEPSVRALVQITVEFLQAYAAAKHEKSLVDFSDMEHFALEILSAGGQRDEAGKLLPSPTAEELQQKYKSVMVDEYQDTNGVQEAILQLVTRPEKRNLFAVGDVKQSIYRFRLADPTLFLGKYHGYRGAGDGYERIDLSKNFRSRPEVLSAINFIFAQVMVEGAMEIGYGKDEMLYAGASYPQSGGHTLQSPVELDIIADDEEDASEETDESAEGTDEAELRGAAREAQLIAERLKEIKAGNTLVFDSSAGAYRPFRWRDAVVLMRSVKGTANEMLEVLRRNDIPAYASVDAGYFQEQEIRVMLALLTLLDNARQDIPLAAVMLSPIGGFTPKELAELRQAAMEEDLYTALHRAGNKESGLPQELSGHAARFAERLSGWRVLSRELSVPELIWQLYRDTGYYDYVGGLPGGLLKQANLRMLVDRAAAYEETSFRGLFRFLRFVERMQDMDTDLAVARTLGESEDVVRIMSIHKSKGLEFPVVFVASLGKKFNLRDATVPMVLIHRELGLGPYRVEQEEPLEYPTFARHALAHVIRQENKAEEMRILYVALTRARERLILVGSAGTLSQLRKRAEGWCRYTEKTARCIPDHAALGADCFLDWIAMAVAHHGDGAPLRELSDTPRMQAELLDYTDDSRWEVHILKGSEIRDRAGKAETEDVLLRLAEEQKPMPETEYRAAVEAILDWSYDMRGLSDVPAKLSVTELKRRFAGETQDAVPLLKRDPAAFRRPAFLREQAGGKRLTGTEYGTLMHSVMQHIRPEGELSAEGIAAQLDDMVRREIFRPEEIQAVRAKDISAFFRSPLGMRLRHAKQVYRELPFSRMLDAKRFYPEVQEEGQKIFSQGIIDLLFRDADDKLILVDYKTDRDTHPERAKNRYQLQITLYSEAVEQILGAAIDEKYLYLLHDGTIVAM